MKVAGRFMTIDLTPSFLHASVLVSAYGTTEDWRRVLPQVAEHISTYCGGVVVWDSSAGETWASICVELQPVAYILYSAPLLFLSKRCEGAVATLTEFMLVTVIAESLTERTYSLSPAVWKPTFGFNVPHSDEIDLMQFSISDLWGATD
jgi:hypothetical protein